MTAKSVLHNLIGGEAVALVSVDGHIASEVVARLEGIPGVKRVKPLRF